MYTYIYIYIWLVISAPLKNMKVSWADSSQLNGKIIQMFQTTNHIYIHPYFEQKIRCEVYKVPNEVPSSTQSPLDFRVHLPSG